MKRNTNRKWSKEQADFINSVMRSSSMDPNLYIRIKNAVKAGERFLKIEENLE